MIFEKTLGDHFCQLETETKKSSKDVLQILIFWDLKVLMSVNVLLNKLKYNNLASWCQVKANFLSNYALGVVRGARSQKASFVKW